MKARKIADISFKRVVFFLSLQVVNSTNGEVAPDDPTGNQSNAPFNNQGQRDEDQSETK